MKVTESRGIRRVSEGVMPASERVVAGVLGLDNETEREIHIHAGTTDCCHLRGYNPKSEITVAS